MGRKKTVAEIIARTEAKKQARKEKKVANAEARVSRKIADRTALASAGATLAGNPRCT